MHLRHQLVQRLEPLDGCYAFAHLLGQFLIGTQRLFPAGDLLLGAAATLPPHGVSFHLIGPGLLHGADHLAFEVGVHHGDDRLVPVQIPHNGGNDLDACQLAGPHTAVAGHHFVTAGGPIDHHDGFQDAVPLYALYQIPHILVVLDIEGVALKGMDVRHLQRSDKLGLALFGDGQREVFGDFKCFLILGGRVLSGGGLLFGRMGGEKFAGDG